MRSMGMRLAKEYLDDREMGVEVKDNGDVVVVCPHPSMLVRLGTALEDYRPSLRRRIQLTWMFWKSFR